MDKLNEQIALVAQLRQEKAAVEGAIVAARRQWEADNAVLLNDQAEITKMLEAAESELRTRALQAYHLTGSKNPAPGIGIRVVTRLKYTETEALLWAREHGTALKLDKSAFDKIALAAPGMVPFVTVTHEPTATLARDLSVPEGE